MTCTIIRKKDQNESVWSGGKTTQLFIYPAESSYASRNFAVRISSAVVEEETSVFTSLPGFHRILMPISGAIKLTHEGHKEVHAEPYQAVEFEGGWRTTSHGKCTDFGIMLAEGWHGSLYAAGESAHAAGAGESAAGAAVYKCRAGFVSVYALLNNIEISAEAGGKLIAESLNSGDFLLLESAAGESVLTFKTDAPYGAVIANIWPVN